MALVAPEGFVDGSTEPWIVDIICALLKASDHRTVLECGAFVGATTVRLAQTLADMGGGTITGVEVEWARAQAAQAALEAANLPPTVTWTIAHEDVLAHIARLPNESIGLVWVDDAHDKPHVTEELTLLFPKMAVGGIICGHDVWGSTDLQEVFAKFGGYSLELPRLGPAGGLGILQCR